MAQQRPPLSDYISILRRSVAAAQNEIPLPRGLTYDRWRIRLGGWRARLLQTRGVEFQQQLMFEIALAKLEVLSRLEEQILAGTANAAPGGGPAALGERSAPEGTAPADEAAVQADRPSKRSVVLHQPSGVVQYDAPPPPAFLTAARSWQSADISEADRTITTYPNPVWNRFWIIFALAAAWSLAFLALVSVLKLANYANAPVRLIWPEMSQSPLSAVKPPVPPVPQVSSASQPSVDGPVAAAVPTSPDTPPFELPTVYGIYAISGGKPIELEALPIRVPDPRIAISAIISTPSATTLATGKIVFVLFRRDLLSSAPDRISIRAVARIEQELKFSGGKAVTTNKVDSQWAIRSTAYEFRVAPLKQNQEMLVVRPEDPDFTLPAGRYALVIDDVGYDFTVAGPIKTTAQCLERSESVGGSLYSECRAVQ